MLNIDFDKQNGIAVLNLIISSQNPILKTPPMSLTLILKNSII